MKAIDFEYDNKYLSDFGFMICTFDDKSGVEVVSAGSNIEFTKVSVNHGKRHIKTSAEYTECLSAEFDIIKDECLLSDDDKEVSDEEFRSIMRWLNRKKYLRFRLIDEDNDVGDTTYFNASFNVQKILVGDIAYGMRLSLTTDAPFGYGETVTINETIANANDTFTVEDISDEIGFTYPTVIITVSSAGDLYIKNETIGWQTIVKNCVANEVITIDCENKTISTSSSTHKIYNDFNFKFLKLQNTIDSRLNTIKVSLPSEVELSYKPIIKNGIV